MKKFLALFLALTQEQKDILVESVKNALANPYAVTPSQYQ